MKQFRRLAALILALALMAAFAAPALAASPEFVVRTLPLKQWMNVEKNVWGMPLYKLKLAADSRVTVNWKDCTGSGYYFCLFKTSGAAASGSGQAPLASLGPGDRIKGSKTLAVAKGTYYAYFVSTNGDHPAGQVKVSAAKITGRKNYTPKTAYRLKKNTTEKIAQVPLQSHACWYKIKTTKSQKITVTVTEGAEGRISLYDKDMATVSVNAGTKKVTTANVCAPGTYYIKVKDKDWFGNPYCAESYIALKWK